jgi:predicted nucleic acid-binding protein
MTDRPTFVLDTFALLAYLQDEPVAARIEKLLESAQKGKCRLMISIINLGEILYITERRGGVSKAQDALPSFSNYPSKFCLPMSRLFSQQHTSRPTTHFPTLIPSPSPSPLIRML